MTSNGSPCWGVRTSSNFSLERIARPPESGVASQRHAPSLANAGQRRRGHDVPKRGKFVVEDDEAIPIYGGSKASAR